MLLISSLENNTNAAIAQLPGNLTVRCSSIKTRIETAPLPLLHKIAVELGAPPLKQGLRHDAYWLAGGLFRMFGAPPLKQGLRLSILK